MTEAEWLACDDPRPMLDHLRGRASDRKLRLFACACARHIWHLIPDDGCRNAVGVAERYADGLAGEIEIDTALAWAVMNHENLCDRLGRVNEELLENTPAVRAARLAFRAAIPEIWMAAEAVAAEATDAEKRYQACLLRDICGPLPFRPVPTDLTWLAWNGGTVPKLAQAIYDDRAFGHLPVLADALEDAGCADPDLLAHCRQGGEHVRGCWAVDLMLGKD